MYFDPLLMKKSRQVKALFLSFLALTLAACGENKESLNNKENLNATSSDHNLTNESSPIPKNAANPPPIEISIDAVYFAQTHVLEPKSPMFRLVSNRKALIKANIISSKGSSAPQVYAALTLKEKTLDIELTGPGKLPSAIPKGQGVEQHNFEDSFTAFIPKEWVQPGLKMTINAGSTSLEFNNLGIGAPTLFKMRMFDIHFFALTPSDYRAGWLPELEAKLPVASIELQRLNNVVFKELVIPPRGANLPAARISSKTQYKDLTGFKFDGEQAASGIWNRALQAASGTANRTQLYYSNIYGAFAGGQAGGFAGVGNGNNLSILHHELGHALSLPHWGNNASYPYRGVMFGIPAPNTYNSVHVGPTWAFDPIKGAFLPPTVQPNPPSPYVVVGTYKADPMQGGGVGDQERGYLMRHFSDYSVNKIQNYLEQHVVVWNDSIKSYAAWNNATGDYSRLVTNNGVQYPVARDVQVISVMASVSAVTPQANLAYPPIGPYAAGLITLFDPTVESDRTRADEIFCPADGCDVSLRVTQGLKTKTYLLSIALKTTDNPFNAASFHTRAINLPASNGAVTKIELLLTPDAEKYGLPSSPEVLDSWIK